MKTAVKLKTSIFMIFLLISIMIALPLSALAQQTGTVNSGSLKLRSRKSQDSIVMAELSRGDKLEILDETDQWYKVKYGDFTGYVMKEYVKVSGSSSPDSSNRSSTDGTLRNGDKGSEVKRLQRSLVDAGVFSGKADGIFGDATEDAVKTFQRKNGLKADGVAGSDTLRALNSSSGSTDSSSSGNGTVTGSISDIGSTPGTSKLGDKGTDVKKLQQALAIKGYNPGKIDGSFGEGTEKAVKAFQKDQGMSQDGVAGTVTITLLFGEKPSDTSSTTGSKNTASTETDEKDTKKETGNLNGINNIADIGSTPGTSKSGDSGTYVKKLQQALSLKGYYNGSIDGSFGEGTEKAVKAFQKSKGMSQDGVAGTTTIKLLFGEKPADTSSTVKNSSSNGGNAGDQSEGKYATETLNWFEGGNTAIPKGATFTIKDVSSGKTFQAKRWSGGNHMDAEPLTSQDSDKMKDIYGGNWSWKRRAILIKYNGHVYAASMNGMGHGDDTISSNSLEGHFCIHFEGSKTHGTDKVDSEHQNMVDRASKATW